MTLKNRITTFLLVLVVILAIGGELLLSLFAVKADAAESTSTTYSNVLDDLTRDNSFDASKYPVKENSSDIEVIHIAEGEDNELYIYTYQPGNSVNHRKANYLNMSLQNPVGKKTGELTYERYSLTWLNSNGVFDKYIVNGFKIQDASERYYNISAIYRPYDVSVDFSSASEAIDTVQCKSFGVGQYWRLYYYNDILMYESKKIDVVEYTIYATGTVRYTDGFNPSKPFTSENTDSHYAAFTIDNFSVDQIIDADITYEINTWQVTTVYNPDKDPEKTLIKTEKKESEYISNKESGSNDGSGWFGKKYTWDRILSVAEFVKISQDNANDTFNETETAGLNKSQFVFAFAETSHSDTQIAGIDGTVVRTQIYSETSNFGILRLHFISDNKTYNLGCVGDLVGTDEIPELVVDLKDNIKNGFEDIAWYLKVIIAVVIGIGLYLVLKGPVKALFKLIWSGIKGLFLLIGYGIYGFFWIITWPFRSLLK